MFPRHAAAAEAAVIKSTCSKDTINVLNKKRDIYINKKLVMLDTLSDETFLPVNLTGTTAFGCNLLYTPLLINLRNIKIRTVLTDPLVDDEQPSININKNIID